MKKEMWVQVNHEVITYRCTSSAEIDKSFLAHDFGFLQIILNCEVLLYER